MVTPVRCQRRLAASRIPRGSLRKTSLTTGFLILYIRLMFAMWSLHKPTKPERFYVDFDGFFASCEEQADPRLFGHPVGVIPFRDARNSCVIAANSKAKRFGVKTGIAIAEARRLCPRIALVPQRPDLYVRTQQRIVCSISGWRNYPVSADACVRVWSGPDSRRSGICGTATPAGCSRHGAMWPARASGTHSTGHCQVNRNSLIFDAISILASTKNQRLSWHVNQWNLQEIN